MMQPQPYRPVLVKNDPQPHLSRWDSANLTVCGLIVWKNYEGKHGLCLACVEQAERE
jgi:hypothetical protein